MALTPESRARGIERSAQVRTERMMRRAAASDIAYRVVTELDDVAPAALQAALVAMQRAGEELPGVTVETPLDVKRVAETAEILHRISRLASGQSTANVAHAQLTDEERKERMAHLRSIAEANQAQRDADAAAPPAAE